METHEIIAAAEESFAREVALGAIVSRPPPLWQSLIPGMFIFDYLRRSGAIRRFKRRYLLPRRPALKAAQELRRGGERTEVLSRLEDRICDALSAQGRSSPRLRQAQFAVARLLADHYLGLLGGEGTEYPQLVGGAYPKRERYEEHLRLLAEAEERVEDALLESAGNDRARREHMLSERRQTRERREKFAAAVFLR